ncbi:MAG: ABC transporter permease [Pseudomonadota bacterium]
MSAAAPAARSEARAAALVLIVGALILLGLVLAVGENPLTVLWTMVESALLTANGLADTAVRAIPLCLIGLGVALAFRAGVFNIGADGQLLIGTALAVACAPLLAGWPVPLGIAALLVAGVVGGAVWGGLAGVLKARFGANEIIATIMLNYVAIELLGWLVRGPLQEPMGIFPQSARLEEALRLPTLIDGTRISAGLIIALAAVLAVWFIVARLRYGYSLTLIGQNVEAARYGGVRIGWITVSVMALSGGLAGLAGIVEVSGLHGRIQEGFAPGFGITGIAVALLARLDPLRVPIAAFAFAALYVGSANVARSTDVPFPLVHIIEAAIILGFLAATLLKRKGGAAAP